MAEAQKYSRLRCLLRVKGLVICFYLGWSGSILQFRQNMIKVVSMSWLLTCSSNISLKIPSYTGSALKREVNFVTAILVCCIFACCPFCNCYGNVQIFHIIFFYAQNNCSCGTLKFVCLFTTLQNKMRCYWSKGTTRYH